MRIIDADSLKNNVKKYGRYAADKDTWLIERFIETIDDEQSVSQFFDKSSCSDYNKYKWHDLRKNPDDLPKRNKDVLVCFEDLWAEEQYTTCYYGSWFWDNHTVIAWKEIESFGVNEVLVSEECIDCIYYNPTNKSCIVKNNIDHNGNCIDFDNHAYEE